MVYADTGVGKSMFALSAALGCRRRRRVLLGWKPEEKPDGSGWRVLYVDGEMHVTDIQERAKMLLDAVEGIDPPIGRCRTFSFSPGSTRTLKPLSRPLRSQRARSSSLSASCGAQAGPCRAGQASRRLERWEDENDASVFNANPSSFCCS